MKKLVYLAGPYTHPDPVENTHRAVKVADQLIEKGFVVLIPHLSLLHHMICPRPPEFWYDYDLELMRRCDVVYRLKGFSKGADIETTEADKLGIPVIYEGEEGDLLK